MAWGKVDIPADREETPDPQSPTLLSPQPLPYASVSSQRGILIDRWRGGARVIVPPPRDWRIFVHWGWIPVITSTTWFVLALTDGRIYYFVGVFALISACWMLYTFWRPLAFEVDEREVRIGFVRGRSFWWTEQIPRAAVGEIRMNSVNGKLLIRITGKDLKEVSLRAPRKITSEVASALQAALSERAASQGA